MRTPLLCLIPASFLVVSCADNPNEPSRDHSPSLSATVPSRAGALFVMTNAADANAVMVFPRAADGSLGSARTFPTGGLGAGTGLGNQGSVLLAPGRRFLYVVNPGSDEITGFRVREKALDRIGTWASGGDFPISLSISRSLLYVLHDGASPGVAGFVVAANGVLTPIPNSIRALSGNPLPDAAQVSFSPDGRRLVVTEKASNLLLSYGVMPDGRLSSSVATPSAAPTPFGFAFGRGGVLLVSEAAAGAPNASSLSSYLPSADLAWLAVSPAVGTTETAACWVGVTANGRLAFVTNTGSGTISGYRVRPDGSLELLDTNGVTATTGAGPIDLALVGNRYLYTLNAGGQSISAFRVTADGDLAPLGTTPGLPVAANGLQAF